MTWTARASSRQSSRRSMNSAPARSACLPPRSRKWPTPASATLSPTTASQSSSRCPASVPRCRWCSAACFRSMPRSSRNCAPPWVRCGFLGLLHLEIIQERLSREFNLDLIATAPSVIYKMALRNGTEIEIHNPVDMPDPTQILEMQEPWIEATILTPDEYLGSVLKLCQDRRGEQKELTYVGNRAMVKYNLPLNEVVFDFYDRLKSVSRGYASFDYHLTDYRPADLVKLQMLVNSEPVDSLAMLVHRTRAESRGRAMAEKLKELIPPHMFQVPIQAAIGGKIIARETVRAFRKDVTAKCYGGDATRKRKLLEKQKEGKKRMRQFGKVDIPQEAFIAALKVDV